MNAGADPGFVGPEIYTILQSTFYNYTISITKIIHNYERTARYESEYLSTRNRNKLQNKKDN
jgi:hypothetical protein